MKFSIIIPSYNRAVFLPKAIESVLAQTYQNWELIIVDDGSTDNTKDVVSQYTDKRIQYVFQHNAERSAARNNGIRHATGDIICFMDSDNYYLPERLENLKTSVMKCTHQTAMFYTDIIYHYPETDVKKHKKGRYFPYPIDYDMLILDVIATPQVCISKEILQKHTFNERFNVGEDMELWFRIAEEFPIEYLKESEPTVIETEHEGRSVNYNNYSNVKQLETIQFMFFKHHPSNKVSSKLKNRKLSEAYIRASYYYIYTQKQKQCLQMIIKSILSDIRHSQTKFKLNLLRLILLGQFEKAKRII